MAWYNGTYMCGHEGRVNIIGPSRDREWKRERIFSHLCPECEKKENEKIFEQRNAMATEECEKMELPVLSGTSKQVAWANTLRLEMIEHVDKLSNGVRPKIRLYDDETSIITDKEEMLFSLEYGLATYTDAKYWIDRRYSNEETMLTFIKEYRKSKEAVMLKDIEEEIKEEEGRLTVKPTESSKEGVVVIKSPSKDILSIQYMKDEVFRMIAKKNSFSWDWESSCWSREIDEYSGDMDDRAAEIGNQLLSAGFTVRFMNQNQLEMAVSGDYKPECKRWIKYSSKKDSLFIVWKERNDTLYNAAKKISGAHWGNGVMYAPVACYKQVEDFAETLNFKISVRAQEAIQKKKDEEDAYITKDVKKQEEKLITDEERLKKMLESSGTIIGDLMDEMDESK